jgi:uncharacterized membrane protein YcaP (DUF421 family)
MNAETKLYLEVAINSAIIYAFLVIAVGLIGRRQLGQLSSLDLVVLILLGSAVETAMVRANTSLTAGLVSATTLLILNKLLTFAMTKSRRLRHLAGQGPLVLVHNGKFIQSHLDQLGLTKTDVVEAMRARDCASIEDVRYAVFEANGEVHIVTRSKAS